MNVSPPTLRRRASGLYFARWGGRDHYFTRDKAESNRLFFAADSAHPGAFRCWQAWRDSRVAAAELAGRRPRGSARITVVELVERFLARLHDDGRPDTERYYRLHLRRFVRVFGAFPVETITAPAIDAHVQDLRSIRVERADGSTRPLGAKTIDHDVKAIKRLWSWGSSPARGLCEPLNLGDVRGPRVRKGTPEDLPLKAIVAAIAAVESSTLEGASKLQSDRWAVVREQLAVWLRLNYLCLLRPTEVVRLAHGQGIVKDIPRDGRRPAIARGYVELPEHKMSHKVDHARLIPLSAEALLWLDRLQPLPKFRARSRPSGRTGLDVHHEQNRYAAFCRLAGVPGLPHKLRDSAATHLRAVGVDSADVDLLLGHEPRGELARYAREAPRLLRERAARLSLK